MNKISKFFIILFSIELIAIALALVFIKVNNLQIIVQAQTEETIAIETESTHIPEPKYTYKDLIILAKLIYGEASIVESKTEQAAVVWCVLNRMDDPRFPNTIEEVVKQPYQFAGYSDDHPVYDEYIKLAKDVLDRYYSNGYGRVLPEGYLYFVGRDGHNWFTKEYRDMQYYSFDFSSSPYNN